MTDITTTSNKIADYYRPSCKEIRSMRELTGLGAMECKELLTRFSGNLDECARVMRANSDEPWHEGLTEGRVDILKGDKVIFSCKSLKEAKKFGFCGYDFQTGKYEIRFVDCFGRYEMIVLK